MSERQPYVGTGRDGCLRSAEIDRSEADGLDRADPRRDDPLRSAREWERLAATPPPLTVEQEQLVIARVLALPNLTDFDVSSALWGVATALLEIRGLSS